MIRRKSTLRRTGKLSPISPKRKQELSRYSLLRRMFLQQRPFCEVAGQLPTEAFCTRRATQVHHRRRRGKYLCEVSTFVATCHACHRWLETHAHEARAVGLIVDR